MELERKGINRVLVIEDQHMMRHALMREMTAVSEQCVVSGAPRLDNAVDLLKSQNFDLIVIDPGLPGHDPSSRVQRAAVVLRVIELAPTALHFVITGLDSSEEADAFKQLGVAAYLAKTELDRMIFPAILQEISDTGFCMRLTTLSPKTTEIYYAGLTPREQEMIDFVHLLPSGLSQKEIYHAAADHFHFDVETAKKHFKQARAKLMKNGFWSKDR